MESTSGLLTLGIAGAISAFFLTKFEVLEQYVPFWYLSIPFAFDIFYQQAIKIQDLNVRTFNYFWICFLKRVHKFLLISFLYFGQVVYSIENFKFLLLVWFIVGVVFFVVPLKYWKILMEQVLPFRMLVVISNLVFVGGELRFYHSLTVEGKSKLIFFSDPLHEYLLLSFVMGIFMPMIDYFLSLLSLSKKVPLQKAVQSSFNWGIGAIVGYVAFAYFESHFAPNFSVFGILPKCDKAEFVRRAHFAFYFLVGGYNSKLIKQVKQNDTPKKSVQNAKSTKASSNEKTKEAPNKKKD